LIDKRTQKLIS